MIWVNELFFVIKHGKIYRYKLGNYLINNKLIDLVFLVEYLSFVIIFKSLFRNLEISKYLFYSTLKNLEKSK